MGVQLSDDELRMELDFNRRPLDQIRESAHEWHLGTWSLSKVHRLWRVGVGHDLLDGATVRTLPIEIDGIRRVGVLFASAGTIAWIFIGWVPPARAVEAERWATFLNDEIANRLAGRPAGVNWTFDPHDGSAAQDCEDEIAKRRFEQSLGVKPFRRR